MCGELGRESRREYLDSLLCSGDDDDFTRQVWDVAHWVVGHGRVRMWIYNVLAYKEGIYERRWVGITNNAGVMRSCSGVGVRLVM